MNSHTLKTYQQTQYESIYVDSDSLYGFPDRKIDDGKHIENKIILNLGSGTGSDTWYLTSTNCVVGVDYALSGLIVGKHHGIHGVINDLNHHDALPYQNEAFDIVICKDILEHLLEPISILQEIKRILKKDGYLIISVPNHFYLPMRLRYLFGKNLIWKTTLTDHTKKYNEWNYMHIRFFTYKGFQNFLREANLYADKWFWDFGNLAHYRNPDMWLEPQLWKKQQGYPISKRGKLGLSLIHPLWTIFNFLLPRRVRSAVVALSPGLLCAGSYVRVRKNA